MLDVLLQGGEVVDGTGAKGRRGDIGIAGGRIVLDAERLKAEEAARSVNIDGLVVAPGFVDVHTHYDAQLLWDPMASPSPLHGVTTVLGGNCGFTIAPLGEEHVDYVMRMMARVEGIPLDALMAGPAWTWHTFGEWLQQLDGTLGINAGFLVGHSTVRRVAMGDAAVDGQPTPEQLDHMVLLVHDALSAGALGLSTSWGEAHTDGDNRPVPSRAARRDEMVALAAALRDHEGTSLELIPAMGLIPDERVALMTEMSLLAQRPLNWNLLGHLSPVEIYNEQLASCDYARQHGADVVVLTLPDVMRMRAHRVLEDMPVWRDVVGLPADERRRLTQDPTMRARLHDGFAEAARRGLTAALNFERLQIADAPAGNEALVGRSIASLADERGADPVDVLIDVVLPDRLPLDTVFPSLVPELGLTDEAWRRRAEVWRDDRTVLGGSDAGAHIDLMCHANYTTVLLGESVRDRGILPLEEAVHQLTDVPARLYGLRQRGRIADGWHADLVVFDPERVGSTPARPRQDLPGGGERMYAEGVGVAHVYVNGSEVVRDDEFTGALGGTLLRSGRDTETVWGDSSAARRNGAKIAT